MSESNKDENSGESLFEIMDGTLAELNRAKRLFLVMILSTLVVPPLAIFIMIEAFEPPFEGPRRGAEGPREGILGFVWPHGGIRLVIFILSLFWVGIGVRQYFVITKWNKRYQRYKERQKEIDRKLDEQ